MAELIEEEISRGTEIDIPPKDEERNALDIFEDEKLSMEVLQNEETERFKQHTRRRSKRAITSRPSYKINGDDFARNEAKRRQRQNETPEQSAARRRQQRLYQRNRRLNRKCSETSMETEEQRLNARIRKIKTRLLLQLRCSDEEYKAHVNKVSRESRKLAKQRRMKETPEQAAKRRERDTKNVHFCRMRKLALETPEETLARLNKKNESNKQRRQVRKETLTEEEREQRRKAHNEYFRLYRERTKVHQPLKDDGRRRGHVRLFETPEQERRRLATNAYYREYRHRKKMEKQMEEKSAPNFEQNIETSIPEVT